MEGVSGPGLVFLPLAGLLLGPHLPLISGMALPTSSRARSRLSAARSRLRSSFSRRWPTRPAPPPAPAAGPRRPQYARGLRPWRPGVRTRPSLAVATPLQLVLVPALQMLPEGRGAHVSPRAPAQLPATQAAGGIPGGVVPGAGRGQGEVPPGLGSRAPWWGAAGGRGPGEGPAGAPAPSSTCTRPLALNPVPPRPPLPAPSCPLYSVPGARSL